jgi:hypothetical protein
VSGRPHRAGDGDGGAHPEDVLVLPVPGLGDQRGASEIQHVDAREPGRQGRPHPAVHGAVEEARVGHQPHHGASLGPAGHLGRPAPEADVVVAQHPHLALPERAAVGLEAKVAEEGGGGLGPARGATGPGRVAQDRHGGATGQRVVEGCEGREGVGLPELEGPAGGGHRRREHLRRLGEGRRVEVQAEDPTGSPGAVADGERRSEESARAAGRVEDDDVRVGETGPVEAGAKGPVHRPRHEAGQRRRRVDDTPLAATAAVRAGVAIGPGAVRGPLDVIHVRGHRGRRPA